MINERFHQPHLTIKMLRYVIDWFLSDDKIFEFIYESPSACMRWAQYSDMFTYYPAEIKKEVLDRRHRNRLYANDRDSLML